MMKQNLVRKANQLLGYTMAVPLAAGALFMPCTVSAATNDVAVVAPTNQTVGQKAHVTYIKRVTNKDEALKQQLIAKTKRIDTKKTPGLKGVEANILIDSMSENKKLFTEKYVLAEKGMNLTVCQEVPDAKIDNVGFIGNTMQMRIKMSQDSCFEALNIKEAKGNDLYALGLEDMGTHYYAYKVKDTATLKKCQVEVTYKKVLAEDTPVEAATWQVKG